MVLYEDSDEALERAEDGPVQHHRDLAGVVLRDVARAQAAGHGEVELDGAALQTRSRQSRSENSILGP